MDITSLRTAYRSSHLSPIELVRQISAHIAEIGERPIWISTVPLDHMESRARTLERDSAAARLPLYGIPFAVKDNIDVAGMPTTAGCPAFSYTPDKNATVVDRLLNAGAILIGKTNMDQFATGLVGVRSPYGACSSVYSAAHISGGSSSGSAVAVARDLVAFALGTDTAGSGRVPAAFNNLVGLKPTRGVFSMSGVVPACRSLDCVSVFATNAADALAVWDVARGIDTSDPYSRSPVPGDDATPWMDSVVRIGIPSPDQLEFFGDAEAGRLYAAAVQKLSALGAQIAQIDFAPFRDAAALLYSGPWVAERLAAIEGFLKTNAEDVHPVVRGIIQGASRYTAADAYRAAYQLESLKRDAGTQWAAMDVLVLPTTATTYTIAEVEADPVRLNTNLGYYTNFVNLMDLAAVAVPAGFRSNGLPFGVSLIGPAFSERALLALASRMGGAELRPSTGCINVAVVGAHLTGQPLNHELTSRGARLIKTCRTAPEYRLYALRDTTPPKPGLVLEPRFSGKGIEVEVWAVPENQFGSFVAGVPPPLGIGNAHLDDGTLVKCFICEPYAIQGSRDITEFGGWRAYRASL